jgi:hypothetical protein
LTSGVKKVVESEPAAFVVDPFHDVHTDGVRGDDVDGVLKTFYKENVKHYVCPI